MPDRPRHASTALLFVLLMLGAAASVAEPAVLSRVTPGVTLRDAALGARERPAKPLQIIAPGALLVLQPKSEVMVICPGDRAVALRGPQQWSFGSQSCVSGRPLPPNTYASLVPRAGRGVTFHGSLLMEAPSRSDDENGKKPVLVRPRSPQRATVHIADAAPDVVWTSVNKAEAYALVMMRGGRQEVAQLTAYTCAADALVAPRRACTAPWPWKPLKPGETVEIRVRAEVPVDPDRPVRTSDKSKLHRLESDSAAALRGQLRALDDLGLSTGLHLLRAQVYAGFGLYNEAAEVLRQAFTETESPAIAVQLADVYLGLGQNRAASNVYTLAESRLGARGDAAARAALHLGLGRLYVRQNEADLAVERLDKAAKLFAKIGLDGDAKQAANEAERARKVAHASGR
ncbi:MAG: hypothetical protein AAF772_01710 [Acidobacteriota bacterium]